MIADLWTVMWKEWKGLFVQRGSMRGGLLRLVIVIGVLGIVPPLQAGREWVDSPMVLAFAGWMPLLLVTSVVADSFAGERERHTLETLLASRLPDRAILFGKVGTAVSYGWGLTMVSLIMGLVTVNVAQGQGELLLYTPRVILGSCGLGLLTAGLAASAGVLVSLRASTVRQAQQVMSIATMVLLFVPIFGVQALPAEVKGRLAGTLATMDVTRIVLIAAAVLAVLDAGLLAAAMARFQRARLILD